MVVKINIKLYAFLIVLLLSYIAFAFITSENYIKKGDQDFNNTLYDKALINYEKAGLLNPLNSRINIKKAQTYMETKNDTKAINEYRKAVYKKNDDIDSKTNLINLLLKNDRPKETLKYIMFNNKKAVQNENFLLATSKVLFVIGNKENAYNLIKDKNSLEFTIQKSIYNFLNGNYDKAVSEINRNKDNESAYKITVRKQTNNIDFYKISVAESLNEINQPYFGKIILEKMLKEGKEYRDVYLYLGNSYLLQNNLSKAKEHLENAKKLDPIFGLTYYLLAQVSFSENDNDKGLENIKLANDYGYKQY